MLVVSSTGKMNISLYPFAPKNVVSRDGFDSPVPRQPAHLYTQAESTYGIPPDFRGGVHLFILCGSREFDSCENHNLFFSSVTVP